VQKEREVIVCGAMGVLFLTQIAQMTQITMQVGRFERAGGTDDADENIKT